MTITQQSTHAGQLAQDALDALRAQVGLAGRLLKPPKAVAPHAAPDALIELRIENRRHRYMALCSSRADRKSLVAVAGTRLMQFSEPGLLVAPYISREIAQYCRQAGLQFLDTHGNAYLKGPGLHVYITGEKNPGQASRQRRGTTAGAAGLRIAFALLCRPALASASYRDIAQAAGVSLGAVSNAFDDLQQRGLLLGGERGPDRQLLEPGRLLDEWVISYPVALRPKLHGRRFSAPDPDWWRSLSLEGMDAAWGGEVGAERLARYLRPATQTLYVDPAAMSGLMKKLLAAHRLKRDPQGPIEILEKFWKLPPDPAMLATAPAVLVYADLMAAFDPRSGEAAQQIRERVIEPAFHPS